MGCSGSSCSTGYEPRQGSENHPCFNPKAAVNKGRVHLPVAPRCNVSCGFCNRKFDCTNESRPGVSSKLLKPRQALHYVNGLRELDDGLAVVGIAGPGDPLANPVETLGTFALIKDQHPDMTLCLSTNGLALAEYVDDLVDLGVNHLTVTVSAVDPEISGRIYRWVMIDGELFKGVEAGRRMFLKQMQGIKAAVAAGMTVKVNSVVIDGVNDHHIVDIARFAASMGAHYHNMISHIPVADTLFAHHREPTPQVMGKLRRQAKEIIPQMAHCKRCRADAVGRLGAEASVSAVRLLQESSAMPESTESRPYVAVASREGVFVNSGLGHADKLLIYAEKEDFFELVAVRPTPNEGQGCGRWEQLAAVLDDCQAVIAAEAGATPTRSLGTHGIRVLATEGAIEDALEAVFSGNGEGLRPPACAGANTCSSSSCGGGAGGACA